MAGPFRFVQIGCGGSGGWLAVGLAHLLEYQAPGSALILVDGDHFEPSNQARQHFTRFGSKAELRAGELSPLFPHTTIIGIRAWVIDDDAAEAYHALAAESDGEAHRIGARALLEEDDVVFPVVDNNATRRVIFDAAHDYDDIDVLSGGNDEALFVSTYHYRRRGGEDVTDHPIVMHDDEFLHPQDRNPGLLSCEERAALDGGEQTLVANMTVAALLLAKVHRHILSEGDVNAEAEQYWDLATMIGGNADRGADPQSRLRTTELITAKEGVPIS